MSKTIIKILIIVGVVIVSIFAIRFAFGFAMLNLFKVQVDNISDHAFDIIEKAEDSFDNLELENTLDESSEINELKEYTNITITNGQLEIEQTQQEIEEQQELIHNQVQDIFNQTQQLQQDMLNQYNF